MANKKWLYIVIAVLAVIVIGSLIFLLLSPGQQIAPQQNGETVEGTEGTTQETTIASGIADSIFDDADVGADKPAKPGSEVTTPEETTGTDGEKDDGKDDETGTTSGDAVSGGNNDDEQTSGELPPAGDMTYEKFIALSAADQRKYQESFGTDDAGMDAFFAWYNAAKSKYEQENPPIDVGDGVVDLGKLPN